MRMKRLILLLITICATNITISAQIDCNMCGTWIGSWNGQQINPETEQYDNGKWKIFVRINKYGGNYKIRIKKEFPNHNWTMYESDTYTILQATENFIYFKLTDEMLPDMEGNSISGYSVLERYYQITYNDGYINMTLQKQIVYEYDRNKRFIGQWDGTSYKPQTPDDNIDLFKDDDDW